MKTIKRIFYTSTAVIALLPFSNMANAQEAQDTMVLEEITVTSQRRSQSLQDVPIAVTAMSADFLAKKDIRTFEDMSGIVPGLVTSSDVSYGQSPLSIRGIGGLNGGGNIFGEEPVAVYLNGQYVSGLTFSTGELFDLASIEVLRGPQGTLYGRNSTAGALLLKYNMPTDELEGYIKGSASTLEDWSIGGAVSGPIVEDILSARLAFQINDKEGFGTNPVDGSSVNGSRNTNVRMILSYTPSDTLKINLTAENSQSTARPALIALADFKDFPVGSPFVARPDLEEAIGSNEFPFDAETFTESETSNFALDVDWDLEWASIALQTGYRDFKIDGAQDSDGTAFKQFDNMGTIAVEQFSQEIRVSSNSEGPLSWIVGGFYIHAKNDFLFTINNFSGFFGMGVKPVFDASQTVNAYAAFADATYQVTDRLSLTLGGRYSYEKKDFANTPQVTTIVDGVVPGFIPGIGGMAFPAGSFLVPPVLFEETDDWSKFTPRAVIDYSLTEDILTYFSFSQGFKSGGFNAFGTTSSFDQETVTSYEVGFKGDLADNKVRLNVSAFYYDYTDLQVRLGVPTGGLVIDNAADAEIKGIEVEATILISEALTFSGNASYLDAKFTSGVLPQIPFDAVFPIGSNTPIVDVDISGNRISRSPEFQAYGNLEYSVPFSDSTTLTVDVSVRYQSNTFFLESVQTEATPWQSGNWLEADFGIGIAADDGQWRVGIVGRNIFDDRHVTQIAPFGGFPNGTVNTPRKFLLQFEVNY